MVEWKLDPNNPLGWRKGLCKDHIGEFSKTLELEPGYDFVYFLGQRNRGLLQGLRAGISGRENSVVFLRET
jgi:hypothetical protein